MIASVTANLRPAESAADFVALHIAIIFLACSWPRALRTELYILPYELVYREGLHVYAAAGGTCAHMGMPVPIADVT
jgi:hypothetical protein